MMVTTAASITEIMMILVLALVGIIACGASAAFVGIDPQHSNFVHQVYRRRPISRKQNDQNPRNNPIVLHETKEDLMALAKELNPVVGYYDPLGIADSCFLGTEEKTIGWLRHAEIKHGRIAMFAFMGYMTQREIRFPWSITLDGTPFPSLDLTPPEQWDALPLAGKIQIILFIGFLEFYSELSPSDDSHDSKTRRGSGQIHYTKPGGKPGRYPSFGLPHPVPWDLYDPLKLYRMVPNSKKARGRLGEIKNGRLAMIGFFSLMCEHKIPGSIPYLRGAIQPYEGNFMAPLEYNWLIDYNSILSEWGIHLPQIPQIVIEYGGTSILNSF